ncbi:MAG: glycosylhydrolase-like jelly roll fold domain-containing protein [Clostridia bacterium]
MSPTVQSVQTKVYTGHSGSYQRLDLLLDSVSEGVAEDGCFPVSFGAISVGYLCHGPGLCLCAIEAETAGGEPDIVPQLCGLHCESGRVSEFCSLQGDEGARQPEQDRRKCRNFSGTMRYTAVMTVGDPSGVQVLDLGMVGETAALWVNGKLIGRRICPPYRFELTDILRAGDNTVEIEVANTLVQQMKDRLSRYMQIAPSGLLGPVVLERYAEE